ncbi:MAG: GDSL-type esterase/lipase family protein [Clostridium perfringens]|nr:GDSL-type esterase/lipase family protein [Clostridium perfringens]
MITLNTSAKIICIGDSLTFGYGVSKSKNWISLLNTNLGLSIVNKGINGDTSTGVLSRFSKDILNSHCKICIIMCGTNDILCNRNIDFIIDNLKIMINDCLSHNIKPIILSPPKVLDSLAKKRWDSHINYNKINENLAKFNTKLKWLCSTNNINFISLNNIIPKDTEYYIDGIHLNEIGNTLIFQELKSIFLI